MNPGSPTLLCICSGDLGPPQTSSGNEQHSSASIFEHVDRMSRSSDASRRVPSKIQLIAMQPMAAPPVQNSVLSDRVAETNKINKEVFFKLLECLILTIQSDKRKVKSIQFRVIRSSLLVPEKLNFDKLQK